MNIKITLWRTRTAGGGFDRGVSGPKRQVFPADELVSTHEIALRLGASIPGVNQWWQRKTKGFPDPVLERGVGGRIRLWWWPAVEEWAILNDLLPDPGRRWSNPTAEFDDLLSATEVAELVGWSSASTAWSLSQRGRFPLPVVDRVRLWSRSDVEEWMRSAPRKGTSGR